MSSWATVRLVVGREFRTRVADKAFRTGTIIMLVVLGAILALPTLVGLTRFTVAVVGPQSHAVVATAKAQAKLAKITIAIKDVPDDATARAEAGKGDVAAALMSDGTIVTRQYLPDQLEPFLLGAVSDAALQQRLAEAHVPPSLLAPITPKVESLRADSDTAKQRRSVAFAGITVLLSLLISYGTAVAAGVVEEKSSRVVEVILAAIRPRQLLIGKVIGIGLVGLLQLGILAVAVGVGATFSDAIHLDAGTLATFGQIGVWFLLGYAFYAALFAGAAATVSRSEDLQQVLTPLGTLSFASFFLGIYASQHPTATLTTVLSYVPPFSPLVMTPRWAGGEVPAWQVLIAMAIMVVATGLISLLGARLYEGAILRIGAKVRLRDALSR
jgi:ABC-2 type transport system permease protein